MASVTNFRYGGDIIGTVVINNEVNVCSVGISASFSFGGKCQLKDNKMDFCQCY